jgi:hypothetical protein
MTIHAQLFMTLYIDETREAFRRMRYFFTADVMARLSNHDSVYFQRPMALSCAGTPIGCVPESPEQHGLLAFFYWQGYSLKL